MPPPEPLPHGLLVLLALLVRSPNRKDEKSEKRNGPEISLKTKPHYATRPFGTLILSSPRNQRAV